MLSEARQTAFSAVFCVVAVSAVRHAECVCVRLCARVRILACTRVYVRAYAHARALCV